MKRTTQRVGIVTGIVLVAGIAVMTGFLIHSQRSPNPASQEKPELEPKPESARKTAGAHRPDHETRTGSVGRAPLLTPESVIALCEKEGPEVALAAAKALTGKDRETALSLLFTHLGPIDPEFVVRELKGAGLSEVHQSFAIDAVMSGWTDGRKALAWVTSEFTGDLRKRSLGKALGILVRTDSEAALAYLETMPESDSRRQAMADLFLAWGTHDPKQALAYLENHLTAGERASSTEYVIGSWARTSPREALAWIGSLQDEALSDRLLHQVAMNWSSVSPAEASAWLASLPESPVKSTILASMAERERNTIHCGPFQAPDQSWKDKPVSEMAVTDFRNWATQEPASARKFLEQAPQGIDLKELATNVAAVISTNEGPAAAFEWARKLPTETGTAALRLAVIAWIGTDPAAAAEKIGTVEPERRGVLASAIAENWPSKDPAAAAAWAASYPGSDQKSLVRTVLQTWSGLDPHEAYKWLGSLPAGDSRDEGISYMLIRESSSNPQALVPWIDLLSTPELKKEKQAILDQDIRRAEAAKPQGE